MERQVRRACRVPSSLRALPRPQLQPGQQPPAGPLGAPATTPVPQEDGRQALDAFRRAPTRLGGARLRLGFPRRNLGGAVPGAGGLPGPVRSLQGATPIPDEHAARNLGEVPATAAAAEQVRRTHGAHSGPRVAIGCAGIRVVRPRQSRSPGRLYGRDGGIIIGTPWRRNGACIGNILRIKHYDEFFRNDQIGVRIIHITNDSSTCTTS
mmetsp:Transcript_2119/g.5296  ORF Transcript_2119/g.5296 Transcript_2119/m.5296 type:complete len:209 (-) Transcript_2119:70-696(-)